MSRTGQKVAIITGGSQSIGASLVAAFRRQGWGVVATARTMKPAEDPDVLTVEGDIAQLGRLWAAKPGRTVSCSCRWRSDVADNQVPSRGTYGTLPRWRSTLT